MQQTVLAIDLGTSRVKTILCSEAGKILARAESTYTLKQTAEGRAEQNPGDWIQAVCKCTHELAETGSSGWPPVVCSITGQMHGPVFLNAEGRVLRDVMICSDFRADQALKQIEDRIGSAFILNRTGSPGLSLFPGPKMLWMLNNEPDVYRSIRTILLAKDYIGYLMTGEFATDVSDASGTMLYNLREDRWDEQMCEACATPLELLPPIRLATDIRGEVSQAFSQISSIPAGVPVVIGAPDLPTTVIGAGLYSMKDICISLGTAGITMRMSNQIREDLLGKIYHFRHIYPGEFISMGSLPGTGFSVDWFEKQILGKSGSHREGARKDRELIEKQISLFFLPFLLGTGSPYMDYRAQGAFLGLSHHHVQADLRKAILEGISFSIRQSVELLKGEESPGGRIIACAGGTLNRTWMNVLADVLGLSILSVVHKDSAVLGAAILGGMAQNWSENLEEGIRRFVAYEEPIEPNSHNTMAYEKAYLTYLRLCETRENFDPTNITEENLS
jgi:xylulokinase